MPNIDFKNDLPGIRGAAFYRPETGKHLYYLAQVLLHGPSPLKEAERELIAAYVSYKNDCMFCMNSHAAAARCLYGEEKNLVDEVLNNMQLSNVTDKMKALLNIAGKVQVSGSAVTQDDINAARALDTDDREIHDTVLIAAAFSMYNRYVDGLACITPTETKVYEEMGKRMAMGYVSPSSID